MDLQKYKGLMRSTENILDTISKLGSPGRDEDDQGQQGFDELRRYIKQGNEFCRDVGTVMSERSELESTYAKALSKLSNKLSKSAGLCMGTLADAWSLAAAEMEAEAELHRQLSLALSEDLYKPIKTLADTQNKTRKPIEATVEKAHKCYLDKKADEVKSKKNAFITAKDREKLYDSIAAARAGRGKAVSEKDIAKMDKTLRKLEESLRKYDKSYSESCVHAEQARQEWDSTIYKANSSLQQLEEERISQMQDLMNKYNSHLSVIGPKLVKSCEKLGEAVISIDTNSDIRKVIDAKGNGANQPEQTLPDYYAEDLHNPMDQERRRQLLQNYLITVQQDIERELKSKEGVEKLVDVYQTRPNFADPEAQEDARQRLAHTCAMLNYLEASHFKLSCAMAELEGRPKPTSKFSQYIERTKDKQGDSASRKFSMSTGTWSSKDRPGGRRESISKGHNVSVLRVPAAMVFDGYSSDNRNVYRGSADGGHVESTYVKEEATYATINKLPSSKQSARRECYENVTYDSRAGAGGGAGGAAGGAAGGGVRGGSQIIAGGRISTSQSFKQAAPQAPNNIKRTNTMPLRASTTSFASNLTDDDEFDSYDTVNAVALCQARVIYDYAATQYDELTIKPGDILTVFDKQEDGWWQGSLDGKVGIFPATYVEQI